MIDKYLLDDLSRMSDEKGHLARWVIQLQIDLDVERRKAATLAISRDDMKYRAETAEAALSAANEKLKGDQVPVAWTDAVELRGMAKDGCGYLFKVNPANPYIDPRRQIMLFTAAKPNALPRHIFSMLVNELRDVPAIGCKRQLIIGALNRHGVIAEPVGD
ncbi:TPA: hypothetical protein ACJIVJ_002927 [Yersinia enterocolitica]